MPDEKIFEIGLAMAGAVSAGAYTAGVIDFLFEALDEYDTVRNTAGWDGPRHAVRVPIMTGASAGGMTSAIAALHAFRDLEHVRPGVAPPDPKLNRLYSSWVSDISIERLLETGDLEDARQKDGVLSLLCCDVLDDIVEKVFSLSGKRTRGWIGRDGGRSLRVMVTLTNVRGVPYSFPIFGGDSPERFGMLNHGDYYEFSVGPGATDGDAVALDPFNLKEPNWSAFKTAALATGAFPVGLRPRLIARPDASWYKANGRVGFQNPATACFENICPDDGFVAKPEAPYSFVSVDGGTIDNEPLELARRDLAGGAAKRNNPNGDAATKAVVLIAPFPNFVQSPPGDPDIKLVHLLPRLGSMLIEQARFKPEELQKAANESYFSRFIVSPSRQGNGSPEAKKYPIACGALGGFSGFLHESFRHHDYLLGRRNAQAFLRWNFALPTSNPLFDGVPIDQARWLVRNPEGETGSVAAGADQAFHAKRFANSVDSAADAKGFPIVPLTERLCQPIEIGPDDRPRPDLVSLDDLRSLIEQRARKVADTMVDFDLSHYTKSMSFIEFEALRVGARAFGAHVATTAAVGKIEEALRDLTEAFR